MSLEPLLTAHPVIQIHAYAAMAAFALGGFVLFRHKGGSGHRRWGGFWVMLMIATGVSSLFVWELRTFGLFSPIHILSVATLFTLFVGVRYARRHNIKAHLYTMQALYLLSLGVAGWFTFMPGRIMNEVVFGPEGGGPWESAGFLLASFAVGAILIWLVRRASKHGRRRQVAA